MKKYYVVVKHYSQYREFIRKNEQLNIGNTSWVHIVDRIRGVRNERLILVDDWWKMSYIHPILDEAFIRGFTFLTKDGEKTHRQLKDIIKLKKH